METMLGDSNTYEILKEKKKHRRKEKDFEITTKTSTGNQQNNTGYI